MFTTFSGETLLGESDDFLKSDENFARRKICLTHFRPIHNHNLPKLLSSPLRLNLISTKDTFTFIGRNFSSGESDEYFFW